MKRMYVFETKDGKWYASRGRTKGEFEGTVNFRKATYALDPRRMRILHLKRKGLLKGLPAQKFQTQFWVEGQSTPQDFFHADTERSQSSNLLGALAKSKLVSSLLSSERDMTQMLLVMSVLGNLALIAVMYMVLR